MTKLVMSVSVAEFALQEGDVLLGLGQIEDVERFHT